MGNMGGECQFRRQPDAALLPGRHCRERLRDSGDSGCQALSVRLTVKTRCRGEERPISLPGGKPDDYAIIASRMVPRSRSRLEHGHRQPRIRPNGVFGRRADVRWGVSNACKSQRVKVMNAASALTTAGLAAQRVERGRAALIVVIGVAIQSAERTVFDTRISSSDPSMMSLAPVEVAADGAGVERDL